MPAISVQLNGTNYTLQIKELPPEGKKRRYEIKLNDVLHRLEVVAQDTLNSTLLMEGHAFDVSISPNAGTGFVTVNGQSYNYLNEDQTASVNHSRTRLREKAQQQLHGIREIKANMPGKIIKVLVEPGEKVQHKQALLVLEAMKMENEVYAPWPGVVREVFVKPGENVEKGKKLVSVEL